MSEINDNSSFNDNEFSESCVFINTNNPKVQNRVQKKNIPLIRPSFPPVIDPKDLLIIGKDNKPTRSPNAFIIYRKVFFKTIRDEGHVLPMTAISSMASQSWEKESEEIKTYYKRLAKEAYNYRIERFPKKVNKRNKRRDKWNVISFKSNPSTPTSSCSSTTNNNNVSENMNLQSPTLTENPLINTFVQFNNALLQNLIMSNEMTLNLKNNDNIQNNIQVNNFEQFDNNYFENVGLNLQQEQTYPSPDLSLYDESDLSYPNLNELFNSFPIENLHEQIEQEKDIQQFDLQQQFSFSQNLITDNDNSTDLNALYFYNFNNDDVTTNTNMEITLENSDFLTDFTQCQDDLRISFSNTEFENLTT